MSSFYSHSEVGELLSVLSDICKVPNCSFRRAEEILCKTYTGKLSVDKIFRDLYDRSIIGNKNLNNMFKFKYREPIDGSEIYEFNDSEEVVIHYGFRIYFINKR